MKTRIVKSDNTSFLIKYLNEKSKFDRNNNFMEFRVSKLFGKNKSIEIAKEKANQELFGCVTLLPSGFLSIKRDDEYLFLFWNYKCNIIDDEDDYYPHKFMMSNVNDSGNFKFNIKEIK
jgi:hypothetical protein